MKPLCRLTGPFSTGLVIAMIAGHSEFCHATENQTQKKKAAVVQPPPAPQRKAPAAVPPPALAKKAPVAAVAASAKSAPAVQKPAKPLINNSDEIGLLRQAYSMLSRADHDYNGHRIHALEHTAVAVKLLGAAVGGEGGLNGEQQGVSDVQLHSALGLLERAHAEAMGRKQVPVGEHIAAAIHEISDALVMR